MSNLQIRGHEVGFSESPGNAAEGMHFDCSNCKLREENPNLPRNCKDGLRISFGVARCGSKNQHLRKDEDGRWQAVRGVRPGASIEAGAGGGVSIRYDADYLLINAQYLVQPSLTEKLLAKVGIDRVLWNPDDI